MDRTKIIARIRAMLDRTTSRGFTEAEAMSAAEKVQELLTEYNLTLGEVSAAEVERKVSFEKGSFTGDNERQLDGSINYTAMAVGYFTDTIVYKTNATVHFFGLPHDVAVAIYLCDLIKNTCASEYRGWRRLNAGPGRLKGSFDRGFANRVSKRLREMKDAGNAQVRQATGRDLVVVKTQDTTVAFKAAFGWSPSQTGERRRQRADHHAYSAGQSAGSRVNLTTGIGSGAAAKRIAC
jgi:hypothetical protein